MEGEPVNINPADRFLALSEEKRAALKALLARGTPVRYTAIPRADQTEKVPLSFGQQRLWFMDQWQPGNPAYNLTAIFPLLEPVDVEIVRQTVAEIQRRQASLRTTFRMAGGEPVQDVLPSLCPEVRILAVSNGSVQAREQEVSRLINDEIRRGFDLQRGPAFRAALLRKNKSECILVVTLHHIIADGWSIGLMYQEFKAIYRALSRGLSSPLKDLAIQYTDFAMWQREYLRGNILESQIAYWRAQLADATTLELPTCRPRRYLPTNRGALSPFLLDPDLRKALEVLARDEGATIYMVLLTAFMVLLHRYTGQQDVVVGCPVAGRSRPETEQLIGFFVNTVAIRANAGDQTTFRQYLGRVRKAVLEALAHQDVPFERVVQELHVHRDLSRNPIFQVTFQLFAAEPDTQVTSSTGIPVNIDKGTAIFDLAFNLWDSSRGVEGRVEYSTDLFDESHVVRMTGHFANLLRCAVAAPDQLIGKLELFTEAERERILVSWNDTQTALDDTRCVHELVEDHAQRRPHDCAVAAANESLTYLQLNRRANGIAHHLRELGVGLEIPVAIYLERSPDFIAAALGVLKAGGAYVPIDVTSPVRRVALLLRNVDAAVLITRTSLLRDLSVTSTQVLDIETVKAVPRDDPPQTSRPRPDTLAYIMYTSGSTGTPKGVEVEHRGLCNLVDWHHREYQLSPNDRASQVASPSFDAAVWEIWPYLAVGASVFIPDDDTRADPDRLLAWLVERRITICFLPTPLAESVLQRKLPPNLQLRALLTGGDRLRLRPVTELPFGFINHYGPTENTVVTTYGWVPAGVDGGNPGIGRPISNNQVYILDKNMEPVPIAVPGEIYVGGTSLARGYRNNPELTAKKFLPNPFDARSGSRIYKTGDIGRFLEDGNVEFLGRIDRQIKIRGFRIEPGEIEAVLRGSPGIHDVVVTAREDTPGQQLVAYYVPQSGELTGDLLRYARERLPDYMVPSAYVELESLPLTENGKIDERSLPRPQLGKIVADSALPRNAVEEVLAGIWAEVLAVDAIGVHDNFFTDCGGHSLLSVSLVSHIREALQIDLALRVIFEAPTIRELADRLLSDPAEAIRVLAVAKLFLRIVNMSVQESRQRIHVAKEGFA